MNNTNLFYQEMGRRITQCRKEKHMSQEKLAELVNLSIQSISSIERGTKAIRPENLVKISSVLGVSTDYLLLGKSEIDEYLSPYAEKMKTLSDNQLRVMKRVVETFISTCAEFNESK